MGHSHPTLAAGFAAYDGGDSVEYLQRFLAFFDHQRPTSMPFAVANLVASWGYRSKSPWSDSFYSMPGVTWGFKPHHCLRAADHWNFTCRGSLHCRTDRWVGEGTWAVGRYADGVWQILRNPPPAQVVGLVANADDLSTLRLLLEGVAYPSATRWVGRQLLPTPPHHSVYSHEGEDLGELSVEAVERMVERVQRLGLAVGTILTDDSKPAFTFGWSDVVDRRKRRAA